MLKVTLDPSSGQSDSYWDIKFVAKFPQAEQVTLTIFNLTTDEQLEILGVTSGYIVNENTSIAKNASSLTGYFNLFNKDKMNKQLDDYTAVDIEFRIQYSHAAPESFRATFYNESKSLDGQIIPFDFNLANHQIDISHNVPLLADIICGESRTFELAVISDDDNELSCHFQVATQKGKTTFVLPSEMLFHDLQLADNYKKKFSVHYVKPEGRNFSGLVNRKYIPIDQSDITFTSGIMLPEAQEGLNPAGAKLGDEFILSDRYYVHTFKEFSGYTARASLPTSKIATMTRFLHEAQDMQSGRDVGVKASKKDLGSEIRRTMRKSSLISEYYTKKMVSDGQRLIANLSGDYAARAAQSKSADLDYVVPQRRPRKTASVMGSTVGGCGCSRKKKNV